MAAVRPEAITKDSLHGAIMARREELAMIRKRTKALLIAQPALADAHKLIRHYVAQLAAKARPELKLQPVKLEFALRWTNPTEYLGRATRITTHLPDYAARAPGSHAAPPLSHGT